MLVKERSSGMYHLGAYFFSRTISHLPLDLLYPSSFVFIVYFMGGLRLTVCTAFPHACCSFAEIMMCTLVALISVPQKHENVVGEAHIVVGFCG